MCHSARGTFYRILSDSFSRPKRENQIGKFRARERRKRFYFRCVVPRDEAPFFSLPFPYPEIVFCYRETAEQRPSRYYSFRHKLGTSEKYAFKTISSFNKTVEDRYRVLTGLDWPTHWRSRNRPFLAKLGPKVLEREHLCAIGSRIECTQPRYCTILWRQVHSSAISIVWPSHCCGVTYS